jgi:YidC/Oxa1 family membrane protein insertase
MFHTLIIQPLTNSLVFLTSFLGGNIGLAVVVMTILVKLVLLPFAYATAKSQRAMKKIQPMIDEIKKNHPDTTEQSKKIMELYKEHNTNPFSGCLPILIQLPLIIGLYQVFLQGVSVDPTTLYSFITPPEHLSNTFLGIIMTEKSYLLAILAGVTQYFQLKLSPGMQTQPTNDTKSDTQSIMMESMQKSMKYTLPVMITVFALVVPAAVALYWVITNIVTLIQEYWITKKLDKQLI